MSAFDNMRKFFLEAAPVDLSTLNYGDMKTGEFTGYYAAMREMEPGTPVPPHKIDPNMREEWKFLEDRHDKYDKHSYTAAINYWRGWPCKQADFSLPEVRTYPCKFDFEIYPERGGEDRKRVMDAVNTSAVQNALRRLEKQLADTMMGK